MHDKIIVGAQLLFALLLAGSVLSLCCKKKPKKKQEPESKRRSDKSSRAPPKGHPLTAATEKGAALPKDEAKKDIETAKPTNDEKPKSKKDEAEPADGSKKVPADGAQTTEKQHSASQKSQGSVKSGEQQKSTSSSSKRNDDGGGGDDKPTSSRADDTDVESIVAGSLTVTPGHLTFPAGGGQRELKISNKGNWAQAVQFMSDAKEEGFFVQPSAAIIDTSDTKSFKVTRSEGGNKVSKLVIVYKQVPLDVVDAHEAFKRMPERERILSNRVDIPVKTQL